MTKIQLARMLIADKDPDNYLFTDGELIYLLDKNTYLDIVIGQLKSISDYIYQYDDLEIITIRAVNDGDKMITNYELMPNLRRVKINEPVISELIYIEADILDIDNFRSDAAETIAMDFRKLTQYSIQHLNGNLESAKEHLLRLARHFRKPKRRVDT